ncbi:right-handed parallel beta-helix repeat-containing protein, partial [Zobellia sp.]|nr:right-handed parallel beta-helix repeat-containing protein [Zobellia sp.]
MKMKIILVFILFACIASCGTKEYDFYVSPTGDDNNPGTETAPFATLDKARMAVRELKSTKEGDIKVGLKGGKYILRNTVVFSLEDAGKEGQKIIYKAIDGEEAVLTSETPIEGWEKVENLSNAFPQHTSGNVWVAPLPEGVGRVKYMFNGNKVLPRAMTKGFNPPNKYKTWAGSRPEDRQYMNVPDSIIYDWTDVKDMELVIMPVCDWTIYNMPLDSYDPENRNVKTVNESPKYALGAQNKATWEGTPTAWFANSPEGMLEMGNWYVNTREKNIYLLSDHKPTAISVPTLFEFIRVEGASSSKPEGEGLLENLHFQGLVFTKGQRRTMGEKSISNSSNKNESRSLLTFVNTKNCSVEQCRFENSGGNAISLNKVSQQNLIQGNNIKRLGGTGIVISGRKGNGSFGNQIIGNQIHHIGEAEWSARGISISGSGNLISHNHIHHTPYNGMSLSGSGDNIIEYNEIDHVMEVLGDGNAIYIVTDQKNTVRYNYIHDMMHSHSSGAMRTDGVGTSKNITFQGNIIYNTINGGIILKGFGHQAINNIFVDASGDSTKTWEGGRGWLEIRCGPSQGTTIKNNIFLSTFNQKPDFMSARIPMPARFLNKGLDIEVDKINQEGNIWYSKIIDPSIKNVGIEESKEQGFELEFKKVNAVSIIDGRVALDSNNELFKQGYEYIDMDNIGL